MSGMAKKKAEVLANSRSSSGQNRASSTRQRGIPTRICRNTDRELDDNRNPRAALLNQLTRNESPSSNENLDNEDIRNGVTLSNSNLCKSGSSAVVQPTSKPNSLKAAVDVVNQSQEVVCSSSRDANKPPHKSKLYSFSASNAPKSRYLAKPCVESTHSSETCDSYQSPSHRKKSKLLENRNLLSKNLNKISASDETCAAPPKDESSNLKLGFTTSDKEISYSADHLAKKELPSIRIVECQKASNETGKSSVISDFVTSKSGSKDILHDRTNELSRDQPEEGRLHARGRPEASVVGARVNTRPRSSGPSSISTRLSEYRDRASTSIERSPACKTQISRHPSRGEHVAEASAMESTEDNGKPRKLSRGNVVKVFSTKVQSGKQHEPSNLKFSLPPKSRKNTATDFADKKIGSVHKTSMALGKKGEQHKKEINGKLEETTAVKLTSQEQTLENKRVVSWPEIPAKDKSITREESGKIPEVNNEGIRVALSDEGANWADVDGGLEKRVFQSRPRAARQNEIQKVRNGQAVWADEEMGELNSDVHHHPVDDAGELKRRLEAENMVVLDERTFNQIVDEFATLRSTVIQLQSALVQEGTVEFQTPDKDLNNVEGQRSCKGDEQSTSKHLPTDQLIKENVNLQSRVNELENLVREQEATIIVLKQKLAVGPSVNLLPAADLTSSEAGKVKLCPQTKRIASSHIADSVNSCDVLSGDNDIRELEHSNNVISSALQHTDEPRPKLKQIYKSGLCGEPKSRSLFSDGNKNLTNSNAEDAIRSKLDEFKNRGRRASCDVEEEGTSNLERTTSSSLKSEVYAVQRPKNLESSECDEDEDYAGECSMFDYHCSIDSDYEFCETPASAMSEPTTPIYIDIESVNLDGGEVCGWNKFNNNMEDAACNERRRFQSVIVGDDGKVDSDFETDTLCDNRDFSINGFCDDFGEPGVTGDSLLHLSSDKHGKDVPGMQKFPGSTNSHNRQTSQNGCDTNSPVESRKLLQKTIGHDMNFKKQSPTETDHSHDMPQSVNTSNYYQKLARDNPVSHSRCSDVSVSNNSQLRLQLQASRLRADGDVQRGVVNFATSDMSSDPGVSVSGIKAREIPLQPKAKASTENVKHSRETTASRLPLFRSQKNSKLPISGAK